MSTTEKPLDEDIISRLRDLRLRMNLSQAAFAERFGLSVTTLKQWEIGRRMPDTAVSTYLDLILLDPELIAQIVSRAAWKRERMQTRRRQTAASLTAA